MSPILSFDRTALVLSAGGERAVAWHLGVLAGLAEHGVDARRARRVVGTSAGALVAARLAGGDALSAALPGSASPARPRVVAIDALTGGLRYVDGALGSATNADLAAGAGVSRVLVLDANGPAADPLSRLWAAAFEQEVAALEARGIAVAAIRAGDEDRAAMGADPMDGASAAAAVEAGRLAAARWMARVAPRAVMM